MNLSHSEAHQDTMHSGWQGSLQLTFGFQNQETQVIQSRVQAPLKVQRPFFPEGTDVCHSVILHTAGGIVGGDRLLLNVELQPDANALVTTAAASKIYRSNGQEARQTVAVHIAPHACLEWLPQETIVFDQALYQQKMHIELATGAHWLGWDITRFGRTARGEQFLRGEWRSQVEVWQSGRPLWIDRQWIPGCEEVFHSPNGLAGCPVVGSLAFLGQEVDPELVQQARDRWLHLNQTTNSHPSNRHQAGVSRLQQGLICRYRGTSSSLARKWFIDVWQLLRSTYLNRPVCIPRVWQI